MTKRPPLSKAARRKLARTLTAWGMTTLARKVMNSRAQPERLMMARWMIELRLSRAAA